MSFANRSRSAAEAALRPQKIRRCPSEPVAHVTNEHAVTSAFAHHRWERIRAAPLGGRVRGFESRPPTTVDQWHDVVPESAYIFPTSGRNFQSYAPDRSVSWSTP